MCDSENRSSRSVRKMANYTQFCKGCKSLRTITNVLTQSHWNSEVGAMQKCAKLADPRTTMQQYANICVITSNITSKFCLDTVKNAPANVFYTEQIWRVPQWQCRGVCVWKGGGDFLASPYSGFLEAFVHWVLKLRSSSFPKESKDHGQPIPLFGRDGPTVVLLVSAKFTRCNFAHFC